MIISATHTLALVSLLSEPPAIVSTLSEDQEIVLTI